MRSSPPLWPCALPLVALLCAACNSHVVAAPGSCGEAPLGNGCDRPFWRDPALNLQTYEEGGWYDSDMPWSRGSLVRLPVDAVYIDNFYSHVECSGGGSRTMNSPVFRAVVNGRAGNFLFNHLIQDQLFIPATANHQTYNGGTVIGLVGGSRCEEGYPTWAQGDHFCVEVQGETAAHFFNGSESFSAQTPLPHYQSDCTGKQGGSGLGSPVCPGPRCSDRQCPPGGWCSLGGNCCTACGPDCPCDSSW